MLLLILALVLGHGVQQLLELLLGNLLAQLAGLGEHDETGLDVSSAGFLDKADATQTIGGFGLEDLVQNSGAAVGYSYKNKQFVRECDVGREIPPACSILVGYEFAHTFSLPRVERQVSQDLQMKKQKRGLGIIPSLFLLVAVRRATTCATLLLKLGKTGPSDLYQI